MGYKNEAKYTERGKRSNQRDRHTKQHRPFASFPFASVSKQVVMQNVSYNCMKNGFDLHDNKRTDQTPFVMNGFAKTRLIPRHETARKRPETVFTNCTPPLLLHKT